MFNVQIKADHYRPDGSIVGQDVLLSGQEFEGWTSPSALYAFDCLASHLGCQHPEDRLHYKVKKIKVLVRRSEMVPWGDGELAPFSNSTLDEIVEEVGESGLVDENWQGVKADGEDRLALAQALNTALAKWAETRGISSNVYHEPHPPFLELSAHLDKYGCVALSDEDRAKLEALT